MDDYKTLKGGESATYEFPNGDFDSFREKVYYHSRKTVSRSQRAYNWAVGMTLECENTDICSRCHKVRTKEHALITK